MKNLQSETEIKKTNSQNSSSEIMDIEVTDEPQTKEISTPTLILVEDNATKNSLLTESSPVSSENDTNNESDKENTISDNMLVDLLAETEKPISPNNLIILISNENNLQPHSELADDRFTIVSKKRKDKKDLMNQKTDLARSAPYRKIYKGVHNSQI